MQNMDHLTDTTTGDTAQGLLPGWKTMAHVEGDWGEGVWEPGGPSGDRTLGRSFLTRSSELVSHGS